jgi:hypothetical protein
MMFVYSSTTPYYASLLRVSALHVAPHGLLRLREGLTPRQRRALMLD